MEVKAERTLEKNGSPVQKMSIDMFHLFLQIQETIDDVRKNYLELVPQTVLRDEDLGDKDKIHTRIVAAEEAGAMLGIGLATTVAQFLSTSATLKCIARFMEAVGMEDVAKTFYELSDWYQEQLPDKLSVDGILNEINRLHKVFFDSVSGKMADALGLINVAAFKMETEEGEKLPTIEAFIDGDVDINKLRGMFVPKVGKA